MAAKVITLSFLHRLYNSYTFAIHSIVTHSTNVIMLLNNIYCEPSNFGGIAGVETIMSAEAAGTAVGCFGRTCRQAALPTSTQTSCPYLPQDCRKGSRKKLEHQRQFQLKVAVDWLCCKVLGRTVVPSPHFLCQASFFCPFFKSIQSMCNQTMFKCSIVCFPETRLFYSL